MSPTGRRRDHAAQRPLPPAVPHPRSVPVPGPESERLLERPFEEGAHDPIDADLRHRLISEAAYGHYTRRGFVDGFDLDDWLAAEAEVDHVLLGGGSE